ncbi:MULTISPECIES: efflux transporter outer membrane subunit [Pseudomonadaceae]|uniref:efflux transporter outer membrane subunit n=1 Tax=Pseudomonadaceae TaxID=135621 RepID=UPI00216775BC|nr:MULTISPECIES: efflux transporter outer membrane subunit [Pseudomonadaceae]MCS4063738.1 NodT family efflux transporter outer membrane factor (OMF) lipoprotein [Pseudomonas putida]
MRPRSKRAGLALCLVLQGCSLAPHYQAPVVDLPAHYGERVGDWQIVDAKQRLPAQWWTLFTDKRLDALQARLLASNPTLAAAVAHNDAAAAYAQGLHGGLWPQASASATPLRQRQSDHRPLRGDTQPSVYNSDTAGLSLNFDLDLWGKLRNQVAAGDATAQASTDDLAGARLSLQRQLALLYVRARGLDAQRQLLLSAVHERAQLLVLIQERYRGNIASELDLDRAKARLSEAKAAVDDVVAQRTLAQHAMAELVGALPSDFALAPDPAPLSAPQVPNELPGKLLLQRPDVAAAERRVFAANASIGVARAAWYPDFSLSAMLGGQTQGAGNLLAAANRYWAIGPVLQLPLFDGGRRSADERRARAEFEAAAAEYHGKVLLAVREVEDSLAQVHDLAQEAGDVGQAAQAAGSAEQIALESYRQGAVSLLDVLTAQIDELQEKQKLQELQTRQLEARIGLMVALGGGWSIPEGRLNRG